MRSRRKLEKSHWTGIRLIPADERIEHMIRKVIILAACSMLAACAGSNNVTMGMRSDVFQVSAEGAAAGKHDVPVTITASIKTHTESPILFEPAKHGSEDYRLIVDINGQCIIMPVRIIAETTATDPQTDPESGEGVRYSYKATVKLRPGTYTVTAYLPTENVKTSREVQISADSRYITVKPLYRGSAGRKPASLRWAPSFRDGVIDLNITVN
jgi:hypothetical protein